MRESLNRRRFIENAAIGSAVAGLAASSSSAANNASNKVVVAVMGMSRGQALAKLFAGRPNVELKYVCDVDESRAQKAAEVIDEATGKRPQAITDFRRILDDKSVHGLICAAPNHWHAPATIMACAAGKHVYCEKPCSHNPREGEMMIEAAAKYGRAVQIGTQRRSGPTMREAMEKLQDGIIGRAYLARCWYTNARTSIGHGTPTAIPKGLDYELWQGPAPRHAYLSNVVHYNWHWRWHWGNGELGNNGIHTLDLCRWGLGVDYPTRVTSSGGRYHFQDDQETPDTHSVCYEFEDRKQITWQGLSCNRHGGGFVTFYGDQGTLDIAQDGSYVHYDKGDKQIASVKASRRGDTEHADNFLDAIRNDTAANLNTEVTEGHKSTLMCHLGNISHRVGRTLTCNPANGHILEDSEAAGLWGREYAPGWEPKV